MGAGVFGAGNRGIGVKGVVMRKKAGKAVIYFLVLMLCCTVVARAASSITVAKVKTAKVGKGVLTQTVTGSGTIAAKEEYSQSLPEGQKVKEILVKPQTAVEEGQALVQLDMDYLAEKIEAKNREIEKLNLQLEQQKLAGQEDARTPETAQAQISLNNAEELLAQAQAAYDQAAAEYEELANNPPPAQTGNIPDTPPAADSGTEGDDSRNDAQGEYPDTGSGAPQNEDTSVSEYAQWEQKVQAAEEKMQSAADALNSQVISYNQAVEQYDLASRNEANAQQNEEKKKKSNSLSVEGIQVDIQGAEAELKKLTDIQSADGVVSAGASGIFQSAGVTQGAVTAGTEQIIIASETMEAKGQIAPEDAGKIQEGDKISVKLSGSTEALTVRAERFEQVSSQNTASPTGENQTESGGMVWCGQIEGKQLKLGTAFTYETSRESGSYEQVIPLGSLHETQGQAFVLTAEVRDGILGKVYTAVSVPVTVLDKDDKNAAVKSAISRNSLIITESSKYVEEGNQVRLE